MEISPGPLGAGADSRALTVLSWAGRPRHHGRRRHFQDRRRRHSGQDEWRELHREQRASVARRDAQQPDRAGRL